MKKAKGKMKVCSRGHKFNKSSDSPVCPQCWPGYYKKSTAKTAKHTQYHKDGSIWAKGQVLNSKMHGYFEWFRKDGTKMRSGNFDKNKQIGEWITYDKKGKVYKVTNMK